MAAFFGWFAFVLLASRVNRKGIARLLSLDGSEVLTVCQSDVEKEEPVYKSVHTVCLYQ